MHISKIRSNLQALLSRSLSFESSQVFKLVFTEFLLFSVVVTSGPVHISSGRITKSEIRKQKSKIILQNDDSFNEVQDRGVIGANILDKRANRGKMSSSTLHIQGNEPDYSPDILDNGKLLDQNHLRN